MKPEAKRARLIICLTEKDKHELERRARRTKQSMGEIVREAIATLPKAGA